MAANPARVLLLLCSQVLQWSYRLGLSGKLLKPYGCNKGTSLVSSWTEFIDLRRQLPSQVNGMGINGEWIGTFYRRVIDGKIR